MKINKKVEKPADVVFAVKKKHADLEKCSPPKI